MNQKQAKTILVVDDDKDILDYLSEVLREAQFNVLATTKGKEAVDLATSKIPDLIILDVILPDILGGEVSKRLSQQPSTAKIPVIFLSGLNTKEDEQIMREKGSNLFVLAKPVSREELLTLVNQALPK